MKYTRITKTVFALFFVLISVHSAFADRMDSDDVEARIKQSKKAIVKVETMKPIRYFSHYLGMAKYMLSKAVERLDDGEEDEANHYAVLAGIYAKTAWYKTRTRGLKWKLMDDELKVWKKIAENNASSQEKEYQRKIKALSKEITQVQINSAVLAAGFSKEEKTETAMIQDGDLLIKITFRVNERVKVAFSDFLQILGMLPNARFVVEGHSYRRDRDNKKTLAKAEAFKQLLVENGKIPEDKIEVKAFGNTQPLEKNGRAVRGRANDRITLKMVLGTKSKEMVFSDRSTLRYRRRKWSLNRRASVSFTEAIPFLNLIPGLKVSLEGHTYREDKENQSLSKAVLLRSYLLQKMSISKSSIAVKAFGNARPLEKNGRKVRGRANNRLEMVLKASGKKLSLIFSDREILRSGGYNIDLSETGKKKLELLAAKIKQGSFKTVKITGHTARYDRRNEKSIKKAELVKNYLVKQGIALEIIQSLGSGNRSPLKKNGRRVRGIDNERVEVEYTVGQQYVLTLNDQDVFIRRSFQVSDPGSGRDYLNKVSTLFNLVPGANVSLEGHTYRRDRNNKKSLTKVNAVREFLIKLNIPAGKISVMAFGNEKPLIINGRKQRGSKNDRLVIKIDFSQK